MKLDYRDKVNLGVIYFILLFATMFMLFSCSSTAQTYTSEPNVVSVGWAIEKEFTPDSAGIVNAMNKAAALQNSSHQIITVDIATGVYDLGMGQMIQKDSVFIRWNPGVTMSSDNPTGTVIDDSIAVYSVWENNPTLINTYNADLNTNFKNAETLILFNSGNVITEGTNVGVGIKTLDSLTTGINNTAMGYQSMYSNTGGENNSAFGYQSLYSNTTGSKNTATGESSLYSNTAGNNNTANGVGSLYGNISGLSNTATGWGSLSENTTGNNNTVNGFQSLGHNTTGNFNTASGYRAGYFLADGITIRTTGDNGLYLGYGNRASVNGTDNEIVIGASAIGSGSNTVTLGNTSIVTTVLRGKVQTQSYNFAAASIVTGTANSIVIDFTIDLPALTAGLEITFVAEGSNTGAATLIIDGGAEKNIYEEVAAAPNTLEANDIRTGMIVRLVYDGTQWVMISPSGN